MPMAKLSHLDTMELCLASARSSWNVANRAEPRWLRPKIKQHPIGFIYSFVVVFIYCKAFVGDFQTLGLATQQVQAHIMYVFLVFNPNKFYFFLNYLLIYGLIDNYNSERLNVFVSSRHTFYKHWNSHFIHNIITSFFFMALSDFFQQPLNSTLFFFLNYQHSFYFSLHFSSS